MANQRTNSGSGSSVTERSAQNKAGRDHEKQREIGKANASEPRIVTITFNVTVPESTTKSRRSVFLTGNFHQIDKKVVDWAPKAYPMKRVDATHWTASLGGPDGAQLEYKYTLGDWEHVEQNEHCHDIPNRKTALHSTGRAQVNINDKVHNWRNTNP